MTWKVETRGLCMQDCYTSMCLTAPEVAQYEDGIQTLQTEITSRKDTAKEKEDEISSEGIPLFDQLLVSPSFSLKMDTFWQTIQPEKCQSSWHPTYNAHVRRVQHILH